MKWWDLITSARESKRKFKNVAFIDEKPSLLLFWCSLRAERITWKPLLCYVSAIEIEAKHLYSSIDPFTESFVLPFCGKQQQVNFWGTPEDLGHNGSNYLCGRSKASKLSLQLSDSIIYYLLEGNGNSWKWKFLNLLPPARKRRGILWWAIKGGKAGIHGGTNPFLTLKNNSGVNKKPFVW